MVENIAQENIYDNSQTKIGRYGCIISVLISLYYLFIRSFIPYEIRSLISTIIDYIGLLSFIIIIFSYFVLSKGLEPNLQKILGFLFIGIIIFDTVDTIIDINWGEVGSLKRYVKAIPGFLLFILYFKTEQISFILVVLRIARFIAWIAFFSISPYINIIEKLVLMIWFTKGVKTYKEEKPPEELVLKDKSSEIQTVQMTEGTFQPTPPGVHGLLRPLYWCVKCSKQIKKVKARNNTQLLQPHNCPQCGSVILAWWTPRTKEKYTQFIILGSLFAGGIMVGVIEGNLGSYGIIPAMIIFPLGIIEVLIGSIGLWRLTQIPVSGPPDYATALLPKEPLKDNINEIIRAVVLLLIGGAIIYAIDLIILNIAMGIL